MKWEYDQEAGLVIDENGEPICKVLKPEHGLALAAVPALLNTIDRLCKKRWSKPAEKLDEPIFGLLLESLRPEPDMHFRDDDDLCDPS